MVDWNSKVVEKLKVNNDFKAEKLQDGRVKPVSKEIVDSLTDDEVDKIIAFMGHTPEELHEYSMKREMLLDGGKAAEYSEYTMTVETYDTENNKVIESKKVDLKKLEDEKKKKEKNNDALISASALSSTASECFMGGCFEGKIYANLLGTSGVNYKYSLYYEFGWKDFASYYYTDRIGLAWSSKATKIASSDVGKHKFYDTNGTLRMRDMKINKSEVYGTAMDVPVNAFNRQFGYQKVGIYRIYLPTSKKGEYDIYQGSYAHNWQSIVNGISIGPASINISYAWKQYRLEKNLKIGY